MEGYILISLPTYFIFVIAHSMVESLCYVYLPKAINDSDSVSCMKSQIFNQCSGWLNFIILCEWFTSLSDSY